MRLRFIVLLPLLLSITGFVLAMLVIFAGSKPGYMEEYHIASLNMSGFGKDLIPTPTTGGNNPTSTGSGFGGFFSNLAHSAASEIGDLLDGIEDDIADKLASKLGISQWYALHLTDACKGSFAPNATDPGAWYNVTACTAQQGGYQFNLTEALDHELQVGPLKLNLADLKLPSEIQEAINSLNGFLLATFIFYCLGAGFSGLAVIFCIVGFFSEPLKRIVLTNGILAGLASFTLFIGSIIITVGAKKTVEKLNEFGNKVGISAIEGKKLEILSWVAFAVMTAAFLYWVVDFFAGHKKRRELGGNAHSRRWRKGRGEKHSRRSQETV